MRANDMTPEEQEAYYAQDAKRVYYMSLEFLIGRTLGNSLVNMGLLGANLLRVAKAVWKPGT